MITFVVDGLFCDGGPERERGWLRFRTLGNLNGAAELNFAPSLNGQAKSLRIYGRYLRTSEAVGNFQAGL
jgi:hypothetical protein